MSSAPISPSRGKSAEATKQAMLEAAHARFLRESYENVGLRDIAGDVGVDVALVSRHFGSKEELSRQVLGTGRKKKDILPAAIEHDDIPGHFAAPFLAPNGDRAQDVERLLIILRSA